MYKRLKVSLLASPIVVEIGTGPPVRCVGCSIRVGGLFGDRLHALTVSVWFARFRFCDREKLSSVFKLSKRPHNHKHTDGYQNGSTRVEQSRVGLFRFPTNCLLLRSFWLGLIRSVGHGQNQLGTLVGSV